MAAEIAAGRSQNEFVEVAFSVKAKAPRRNLLQNSKLSAAIKVQHFQLQRAQQKQGNMK
jgi:hypothetical protein